MSPCSLVPSRLDLPLARAPLWIAIPVYLAAALAVGAALCIGGAA